MKRIKTKWESFWDLSRNRKRLFFQVIFLSIYQELLYFLGSSKAFSERISKSIPSKNIGEEQLSEVKDITFAITLANKYIPWNNRCRHQAWQAIYLLNRAGIPYEYHVGVKKGNLIEGHSWVKVIGDFVSGVCEENNYYSIN